MRALQQWLVLRSPGAVPVEHARTWLRERDAHAPGMPARTIEDLLADAFTAGLAQLHVAPPRLATTVGARPVASPLARWQATHRDHVTNLRQESVRIGDAAARQILTLLDGSRDPRALVDALVRRLPGPTGAPSRRRIDQYLEAFARLALLCES